MLIDFFFQMASLSRPNAIDASPIRLITSLALFGTTLPRKTIFSTCSFFPVDDYSLVAREDVFIFGAVYFHTPLFGMHLRAVRLTDGVNNR